MAISRYSTTDDQVLTDLDYKKVYSDKFDKNKREFLLKKETLNTNPKTNWTSLNVIGVLANGRL